MSIFSIGLSGLNAAQSALNTASNNISNVNTPGYNRELTLLGELGASGGVRVEDTQRQFDAFMAEQVNASISKRSALETYDTQIRQIDNLLADGDAGLAPLMQEFFSSLEGLASAPSDPAARQGVLGAADTMAAQFRSFESYLADMGTGLEGQIRSEVRQINNTAEQIAGLNREVVLARGRTGEAPNSLLNQRDQLVAELSERIGMTLSVSNSDSYTVSFGNGRPLVSGTDSFGFEAMASAADPTRTTVGYRDAAGNLRELDDEAVTGGTLGGVLRVRAEALDRTQNLLGQMAVSLAVGFNEQHQQGRDLDGNPGAAFFDVGQPRAFSHDRNTGGGVISAEFGAIGDLTSSDFDLRVTDAAAGTFEITNRQSGDTFTATLDASDQLAFGGVVASIGNAASLADGDRFQVQPVRTAAGGLVTRISDTAQIAAASEDMADFGPGNNENALALQQLQAQPLVGGRATLNQAYASMVGEVGNSSNVVQVNLAAQQGLSEQLRAAQQSVSGVNLDEEAANLIRYQQLYQANARVIETGTTLLDTILRLR